MKNTPKKKRAIVVRFHLEDEEKKLVKRWARGMRFRGIREALYEYGTDAILRARDDT